MTDKLADPIDDALLASPEVERLVSRLALEIAHEHPVPRKRTRRRARRSLALAAVLLGTVATAAGGYALTTHTGWFGDPTHSEEDGSEYLRSDARDFAAAVHGLVPTDVPTPPGGWLPLIDEVVRDGRAQPGLVQETGVTATLAQKALCGWTAAWLAGGGDRAAATDAIAGAAGWRVIVATDGGGTVASLRALGDAARAGDKAPIARHHRANCRVGR